jgi:hypothetical protein
MATLAIGGSTDDRPTISKRDSLPGEQVCKMAPFPPPAKLPLSPSLVIHSVPAASMPRSTQGSRSPLRPGNGPVEHNVDLQLPVGPDLADLSTDAHVVDQHNLAAYSTSLCHARSGPTAPTATTLRSANQQSSIKRVRVADLVRGMGFLACKHSLPATGEILPQI